MLGIASPEDTGERRSEPSGGLVVGAVATLGRGQAAALGGYRTALHAVGWRHLKRDLALAVQSAVDPRRLELLLRHLVDGGRAHVLPHQRQLERHLLLEADVVRGIVTRGIAREEDRRELVEGG